MINIYYTDIGSIKEPSVFEQLYEMVNKQRRSKILRCKNKEDRYRSLAAGLLLRFAMEQQGMDYETAEVSVMENGKPYIKGRENFSFSLSHSGNLAVCVVATTQEGMSGVNPSCSEKRESSPMGADIECISRIQKICQNASKMDALLNRIATTGEKDWFYSLPESEKAKGFLRIWTGKESFGKRNGQGISQTLWKETVLNEKEYLFLELEEDYYVSVCMEQIQGRTFKRIPIDVAKAYLK